MTGQGSSCGACKFLRRKCTSECVFAPYFCYDQAADHFAAVHKVFGASNVSKLLLHLPMNHRSDAAITISYEALARMWDPIYGCVSHIFALQQQIAKLQQEIEILANHMFNLPVDMASCGITQATSNPNLEMQYCPPENAMNIQPYQTRQAVLPNHSTRITGNEIFSLQMNYQLPPPFTWEEQDYLADPQPSLFEELLQGVDQEIFTYCTWLDSLNHEK